MSESYLNPKNADTERHGTTRHGLEDETRVNLKPKTRRTDDAKA